MESLPGLFWNIASALIGAFVAGFATFFWERRKQSLQVRAKMIEPVEEWVDNVNRMIHIVGDNLITLSLGLPLPTNYDFSERHEVSRRLAEDTSKVLAILKSRALQTLGTRRLATQLSQTVERLNAFVQNVLLPADIAITEKGTTMQNISDDLRTVLAYSATASQLVQDAHILISQLKTKLY